MLVPRSTYHQPDRQQHQHVSTSIINTIIDIIISNINNIMTCISSTVIVSVVITYTTIDTNIMDSITFNGFVSISIVKMICSINAASSCVAS